MIKHLVVIEGTENTFFGDLERENIRLYYPNYLPPTPDSVYIETDKAKGGPYVDIHFFTDEYYTEENVPDLIKFIKNYPGLVGAWLNGEDPNDPHYLEL